jgi:ABC-2 type transport system ATP-binding protein
VCSHELSEVEMICDRIAIINRGKLIKYGKLLDLVLQDRSVEIDVATLAEVTWKKLETEGCVIGKSETGFTCIRLPQGRSFYEVMEVLRSDATEVIGIKPKKESLEDLFIRSVKEEVA